MRSHQINHRYSFPPPATMNTVLLKPLVPKEHQNSSKESPNGRLKEICTKFIPRSLIVPQDKLEPFESPLTESNLKFHTTIVSFILVLAAKELMCLRGSCFVPLPTVCPNTPITTLYRVTAVIS